MSKQSSVFLKGLISNIKT